MEKLISKIFYMLALYARIYEWDFQEQCWVCYTYGPKSLRLVRTCSVEYGLGATRKMFLNDIREYLYGKVN